MLVCTDGVSPDSAAARSVCLAIRLREHGLSSVVHRGRERAIALTYGLPRIARYVPCTLVPEIRTIVKFMFVVICSLFLGRLML